MAAVKRTLRPPKSHGAVIFSGTEAIPFPLTSFHLVPVAVHEWLGMEPAWLYPWAKESAPRAQVAARIPQLVRGRPFVSPSPVPRRGVSDRRSFSHHGPLDGPTGPPDLSGYVLEIRAEVFIVKFDVLPNGSMTRSELLSGPPYRPWVHNVLWHLFSGIRKVIEFQFLYMDFPGGRPIQLAYHRRDRPHHFKRALKFVC